MNATGDTEGPGLLSSRYFWIGGVLSIAAWTLFVLVAH